MSKRGRPLAGQDDSREKLIEAAKKCFTRIPFHKVTTRQLAEEAGVNAALIRYYFINKEGLYKEMFVSVTSEVYANVHKAMENDQPVDFQTLFDALYQVIKKTPSFPLLMMKELVLEEGLCRDFLLERINMKSLPLFDKVIANLLDNGLLRPELNLPMLRMNCLALMIFPWLMRTLIRDVDGTEYDDVFLQKLAAHNGEIMSWGSFVSTISDKNK